MKQKEDEEIIAREGNTTINARELKKSLPKLLDENKYSMVSYDFLRKLMLLIEVRLEIIQHTLKPILNDSIEILQTSKDTIRDTNKILDEIKEQLMELKKNE